MSKILEFVLKAYAALFHLLLCAIGLLLTLFVYSAGENKLKIDFIPLTGDNLTRFFWVTALIGLISIALAVTRKFPYLFPVFTLITFYRAFTWLIFPGAPYQISGGTTGLYWILALVAGFLGAFLSSLVYLKKKKS